MSEVPLYAWATRIMWAIAVGWERTAVHPLSRAARWVHVEGPGHVGCPATSRLFLFLSHENPCWFGGLCTARQAAPGKRALVSSSLSCPIDPEFRALSGRLKFTVRRHRFNEDSFSVRQHRTWNAQCRILLGSCAGRIARKLLGHRTSFPRPSLLLSHPDHPVSQANASKAL